MKVNIKDKEITLKRTMRSFIIYESITSKAFNPISMSDIITYFYSVVLASDKDIELSFDDFIDWLDETENVFVDFQNWLTEINNNDAGLTKKKTRKNPKEKK